MKKLLSALLAVALLLAALAVVGSLRWRLDRQAEPPRTEARARGNGSFTAGVAELPLELPAGVALAGFAQRLSESRGVRDPVSVRALVLSEPGCSVALVSVETLLVPAALTRAVQQRLAGLDLDALVLGATHTHAGPGAYWQNTIAERATMGRYRPAVFEALADQIAAAVRRAAAARGPAALSSTLSDASGLARSRDGGTVDGRLRVIRLYTGSGPLAQVLVFPAHPTLLGMENRLLSGDWPGELMRAQGLPTLFFQGALGDQSVRLPNGVAATPFAYAGALARELERLRFAPADPAPPLAVAVVSTRLPSPELGAVPRWLRRLSANLLFLFGFGSERSSVTALRLGPVLLLAVPGEPVAEVGRRWRAAAGGEAEVVSLAGDYLGYVELPEVMAQGAGETVRTFYGPQLEQRLGRAVQQAAAVVDGQGGVAP